MKQHLSIACLLWTVAANVTAQDLLQLYRSQPFALPDDVSQLLAADADSNGLVDLLAVREDRITIYFQDRDGFDFAEDSHTIVFTGDATGWDISSGYQDQGLSVIALINGHTVQAWHIRDRTISDPEILLQGLQGFLTKGINRLHFSHDINGDDIDDLVIPAAGTLSLSIRNPDLSYQPPIIVLSEVFVSTVIDPEQLEREAGQSVNIPLMELRDLNGDSRPDLISRTQTRLDVFLAGNTNSYFQASPSYSIDIAAIEQRLGEFDFDQLDFSNLTGILALTHEEILEDIDGDSNADLLLREGGKVSLFLGAADGIELVQPEQVLRSGGNVLGTFLFDEDEDGREDLWLWRVEPVSVGDLFLWLALSGNFGIEAFIYPNEGSSFARRPTRQLTVTLKFPSALRMVTSVMEITREARESESTALIPVQTANIDNDLSSQDLLVMMDNSIQVFLNTIEPVVEDEQFLGSLGYSRSRDDYEIDVSEIIGNVSVNSNLELEMVSNRNADYRIALDQDVSNGDIVPIDLNDDARNDMLVFFRRLDGVLEGMLLLSRSE